MVVSLRIPRKRTNDNVVDVNRLIKFTAKKGLFRKIFTGNAKQSKLILAIQITVVSDGSQQRTEKLAEMLGQGKANGKGLPKLTISYCLFSRKTGEVAIAKQMSRSGASATSPIIDAASTPSSKGTSELVLDMATEVRNKIKDEVQFTCCSRLSEWRDLAKVMLAVCHINPVEAAQ